MGNEKLPERVAVYIAKNYPCTPPCDSYGVCDNCCEARLIEAGASLAMKDGEESLRLAVAAEREKTVEEIANRVADLFPKPHTDQKIYGAIMEAARSGEEKKGK